MIKYCVNAGCPVADNGSSCASAAHGGRLETLQYLKENGFYWDEYTCELAAQEGHLDVLRYCRERTEGAADECPCPWDASTCLAAAKGGHFKVLQYCKENDCPWASSVPKDEEEWASTYLKIKNYF